MSKTVVETIYGKYCKYEIIKSTGLLSTSIYLYKDGKHIASYRSVEAAVKAAKERG